MSPSIVVGLVNVLCTGLLAGMEILIHYGIQGPTQVLDDRSQLQLRQALVLRLRVIVPAFFGPAAVSGLAVGVLDGMSPGMWYRCAGAVAMLAWIAIRIVGTIPINSATVTWSVDAPPTNWKGLIERAERFHIVGVWAAVIAFASFLTGLALKLAAH